MLDISLFRHTAFVGVQAATFCLGAGMFALTTTTLLRGAGVMPRGVAVVGYLLATWLLLTATDHPASLLVLPAWVLIVAAVLLRHDRRTRTADPPTPAPPADPRVTSRSES